MTTGDEYRAKAAEFRAKAKREIEPSIRTDLENLAEGYLHLAEQADRNSRVDIAYETPSMLDQQKQKPQQQESQQQQSRSEHEE